ncbi:MAG: peptidoglycan DD-metalloendopeptidase family protein [Gammaproteobacteria bacterium]|nr:peptidoglycan DD-metalloendopeptidase family protein [Gammaproteobacteria bacterium]
MRASNGWYYFYTHLNGIAAGIAPGANVIAGQLIGTVGNTGYSASKCSYPGQYACCNTNDGRVDHLHYSIYPDGNYQAGIDPYPYLSPLEHDVCNMPETSAPVPITPVIEYLLD